MEKVLVLMSTYNGEKYLEEQIQSIINQKDVDTHLLIRDDCSKDGTPAIISKYVGSKVTCYEGKNIGAARSFMDLIEKAGREFTQFEYIALADQDDIWLENKLKQAVSALHESGAGLYCGSLDAFTNANMDNHLLIQCHEYSPFETMLRNSVAGCTMVMKRGALDRVCEYMPDFIEMHDSWILRVCYYTGIKIVYDSKPCMRYRIHGNNTCGAAISIKDKIKVHWNNVFYKNADLVSKTAHELLNGYKDYIDTDDVVFIEALDRSVTKKNRKKVLLTIAENTHFSTVTRKIDFIVQLLLGKI